MTSARSSTIPRWLKHGTSLLAAILLLGVAGPARAESHGASFDEANRSYSEGHFADAVTDFETLARTHGWSAPLLYDLANAYAQEGNVGLSVLNYERAQVLAPRDPDIAANLAYVRAKAGLPAPVQPWYQRFARTFSLTTWTLLAVFGFWLACVAFLAGRKWRVRRLVRAAFFAALVGVSTTTAAVVLDRDLDHAVVVERKTAPVRVSPFDTAASEASLSEGEDVSIIGRHGDFVRVRDGQGRKGWARSAAVQFVVPRRS
jgi:hypothetical protein